MGQKQSQPLPIPTPPTLDQTPDAGGMDDLVKLMGDIPRYTNAFEKLKKGNFLGAFETLTQPNKGFGRRRRKRVSKKRSRKTRKQRTSRKNRRSKKL